MAHRLVSDEDFLAKAIDLFRTYGFEGVSIKQLADATGLEKASLYYRYPGGKDEIVVAIATELRRWLELQMFTPLAGEGPVQKRVLAMVEKLRVFYEGGSKACPLEMLSIRGGSAELQASLKQTMQAFVGALAKVAKESGLSSAAARARAEEAVIQLEGALIVGRVMGDAGPFERVMKGLPDLLTVG